MRPARRTAAVVLTALLASSGSLTCLTSRPSLLTGDRSHDGRPDVWRWYDADGRLVRVEI